MRKDFPIAAAAVLMLIVSLASCSKKKETTSKTQPPPGHEKMITEMKKSMAQSKKVTVARVNGDAITMNDLIREMSFLGPRYVKPGQRPTPEIESKVRKDALDILIFRELAVQEAKRQGMKVKPEEIDAAVKQFKARLGSETAYEAYLDATGLTENDVRNIIKKEHLFQMIASKEIFEKVKSAKFDNKDLRQLYHKEKKSFMLPQGFFVEDIFFKQGEKAVNNNRDKAEKVLAELRSNKGDLSKLTPGSYVVRQLMVTRNSYPTIYSALETMKPGAISGIIEGRDKGLHIVKLKHREPARQMTFEEAKHILKQLMMNKAVQERKTEWENQLKKKAKIEIILKGGKGITPVS